MTSKTTRTPTKPANSTAVNAQPSQGFTHEERAAMQERAQELKSAKRGPQSAADAAAEGERAVLAKIAELSDADRTLAERLHALITTSAPTLSPKLWYGMPAYAKGGKVVCFFQSAQKFKTRYATLGFSDEAQLDEGDLWPTTFAVKEWTAAVEASIGALLQKAVA